VTHDDKIKSRAQFVAVVGDGDAQLAFKSVSDHRTLHAAPGSQSHAGRLQPVGTRAE